MNWTDPKLKRPEPYTEVLVWIDGHRGPMWRNNYALVAYLSPSGEWREERHGGQPVTGVTAWAAIESPDD